jgi:hypothetical protein
MIRIDFDIAFATTGGWPFVLLVAVVLVRPPPLQQIEEHTDG